MRVRAREKINQDRFAPGDGPGDFRTAVVSIRIEVALEAADFNPTEAPHDISLVIVPARLAVRDDFDPRLDLLADHLDRHLVLDARKLLARYFAAVAAVDGLAQTGRAGTVRDLGVVADDSCLHGSAFLFCGRFQLLDLFLDLAQLILVLTAILLEHLQVLITAGKRQALRNQKPSGGANRSGTSVAAMSDRNQRRNTSESQSSIGY